MSSDEGRIKAMHARHGLLVGHQCGECARLWQQKFVGGTFWKCREYRITRGTETDWRVRWLACGQFEPAMGDGRRVSAAESGVLRLMHMKGE